MRPNASPHEISIVGKTVSFCTMAVSMLLTLFWKDGLSAIFSIIFAISAQCTPSVIVALFAHPSYPASDIHPWLLAASAWFGNVCLFIYYFSEGYDTSELAFNLDPAFIGLCCNVG